MQDDDIKERIRNLESTDKEIYNKLSDLYVLVERITVSTDALQQAIVKLSSVIEQLHDLERRVGNNENFVKNIKWFLGFFIASGAGLAMNHLFGGG